jgi:hypothetical protein
MNNGILGKETYGIHQQRYTTSLAPYKIKGILLENNQNKIKIDVGNNKIMEAQLKNELKADIGDTVVIEKKEIMHSKVYEETKPVTFPEGKEDEYSRILKEAGLSVKEESYSAVKALHEHGIHLSKENILSFMTSKTHLDHIIQDLDYSTAIKLLGKDINLEKDSLQKITEAMGEIKKEKEAFSLAKLFHSKKELSTEEGEKIAFEIYGSRMGKDITDVMKALHKAHIELNKKNIDRINDIFIKLDNLEGIKEDTFIHSIKNNVEASIDNLYKLKNAVQKNRIAFDEKMGPAAAQVYENTSYRPAAINEQDLKLLEEDIKGVLTQSEMKLTEENLNLSKNFIRNGLELTKDNLEKVLELKGALLENK